MSTSFSKTFSAKVVQEYPQISKNKKNLGYPAMNTFEVVKEKMSQSLEPYTILGPKLTWPVFELVISGFRIISH